jgi:hypothetical protein
LLLFVIVAGLAGSTVFVAKNDLIKRLFNEYDPDMSPTGVEISREEFLKLRNEQMDMLRGFDTAKQDSRANAIADMEQSEHALADRLRSEGRPELASWYPLGPAPIPDGQTVAPRGPVSGRVAAIAVHPTNPNIVYVGAAQGGLYRSLNGGTTWTPIMDSALTMAIGAVAISPSNPSTIYVGTGESTLCSSGCYIGVGVYRITNADTNPVLTGPLNKNAGGADIFSGRAISEVLIHPTDPNIVFVSTSSGVAGIGGTTTGFPDLPAIGVYRSTNAMSASPTFEKLAFGGNFGADKSITDLVMEPGDPNHIYAGSLGGTGTDGGVYYSANALDPVPTFTQLLATTLTGSQSRVELAANKVGNVTTVIAASGQGTGTVYRSVNAAPFTQLIANSFCNPQCFYDIAVAMDPNDASKVYVGGSPSRVFSRSADGGSTFTANSSTFTAGLHVDTQAFAVAPSDPKIFYFGSDGGIWRTNDVTATPVVWTTLNNSTFSATQFVGLAIHPVDRNYSLGGTQDNGTQFLEPNGTTWIHSDDGDGGFAVIDQTATSTTSLVTYHTYFNQTSSQIGYERATTTVGNGDPNWTTFYGCGGTANGISCADATLFYAPMVGGPTAPDSNGTSTLYFGTSKLYRSSNLGVTMTVVSQQLNGVQPNGGAERVSAIGIAPGNDNVRLIGSSTGKVYLSTTAGATTMTDVTGPIPARYVGRVAIDPVDANIAYVALNGFGLAAGQHVWKTTNLLTGTPTWTAAGAGIPDVPVNVIEIDPAGTQNLYAGTDIGVFTSSDGGANWIPFSNGLPRVAVFGMKIQPVHRVLRIATHGRGMYEIGVRTVPRLAQADFDADGRSDLSVWRESNGVWFRNTSLDNVSRADQFGLAGDRIAPGDYDGDGKTDLAVFRPSNGVWYLQRSTAGFTAFQFGLSTDLPAQADYDGDGLTDIAIFRPSTGQWWINLSSGGVTVTQFGASGDRPVQGDYDGDGRADLAVFRPSTGDWYLLRSTAGLFVRNYGISSDKVVPADYDGDGKTDIAVFRESNGLWYILRSAAGELNFPYGAAGDIPSPGDYDGDGKADLCVYRPSSGIWFRVNSATSQQTIVQYGLNGDKPVVSAYVAQ